MVEVRTFHGYLATPEAAADIVTPAYDALTAQERFELAERNPDSFFNVTRTWTDIPAEVRPTRAELLAMSRQTLDRLLAEKKFVAGSAPGFFVYRLELDGHTQTGVVADVPVELIGPVVRRHEHTRREREDELADFFANVGAASSPICLTHRPDAAVALVVAQVVAAVPDLDLVTDDGLRQSVWRVDDPRLVAQVKAAFEAIPALYLTDGHHRAAASQRYLEQVGPAAPSDPASRFLGAIFPSDELLLYGYHRVVTGPIDAKDFLDQLAADFAVEALGAGDDLEPDARGTFTIRVGGAWHRATSLATGIPDNPVAALDVSVLQDLVLGPLLGVHDARSDTRLRFVAGAMGAEEVGRVADATEGVGFVLHPTSIDDLIAVADSAQVMPPKSTWFDPKVRSGLFVRLLR